MSKKVNEKALKRACDAYLAGIWSDDIDVYPKLMQLAVEAYEAELWQPIDDLKPNNEIVFLADHCGDIRVGVRTDAGALSMYGGVIRPTHWRPLPAPPAAD